MKCSKTKIKNEFENLNNVGQITKLIYRFRNLSNLFEIINL